MQTDRKYKHRMMYLLLHHSNNIIITCNVQNQTFIINNVAELVVDRFHTLSSEFKTNRNPQFSQLFFYLYNYYQFIKKNWWTAVWEICITFNDTPRGQMEITWRKDRLVPQVMRS